MEGRRTRLYAALEAMEDKKGGRRVRRRDGGGGLCEGADGGE